MTTATRSIWIAESDGIAHARSHREATRTACAIPAIDERFAWATIAKCRLCVVVLERAGERERTATDGPDT